MVNKKILVPLLAICIVTTGFLIYFMTVNTGTLQVSIKDAPYDDLVSINVDISAIQIQKVNTTNWVPLIQCDQKLLNCSVTGEEESVCRAELDTGSYNLIRIKFNHIQLRYNNDSLHEVDKYANQNQVQNFWLEIAIDFTYDGAGGKILFDITINNDYEAVVTIVQATP